jgi:hypothetical protein
VLLVFAAEARAGIYCWGAEMAHRLDPDHDQIHELIEIAKSFEPSSPRIARFIQRAGLAQQPPSPELIRGDLLAHHGLRVSNPSWNSEITARCDGVEVRCGELPWGYAAEMNLDDALPALNPAHEYRLEVCLTARQGQVAVGICRNGHQFDAQRAFDATGMRETACLEIDPAPNMRQSLMVRNGVEPYSEVHVHEVRILKLRE